MQINLYFRSSCHIQFVQDVYHCWTVVVHKQQNFRVNSKIRRKAALSEETEEEIATPSNCSGIRKDGQKGSVDLTSLLSS